MLPDPTQSKAFRESRHWQSPLLDFRLRVKQEEGQGPAWRSNSFSGNERNRLLMSASGRFIDRSLVSGIDCPEDGRSFAVLDYDQDGWLDIALASANAPRLRLFRNRMEELGAQGQVFRLKLVGGELSNRDAVGALVKVSTSKGHRVYRRSIGEGLSAQNSSSIRITLEEGENLQRLLVRWPSGGETMLDSIPDGSYLELRE